jgi:hypothetical protein
LGDEVESGSVGVHDEQRAFERLLARSNAIQRPSGDQAGGS